ncbi:MAG: LPS export ABC transporter periplasmic protein LptC [Endomicrobium sp.]|nr:LPS export ABC transporter periplasmic protein LptC [Endomicrobium sp.]
MSFYKKRFTLLIYVFFIFLFLIGCKPENVIIEKKSPMSECVIEKFTITQVKDGKLKTIIEADSVTIDENGGIAHLKLPVVKFYDNGIYVSTLISESADIDLETCDVKGIGKCVIDTANNEHLQTTDLMYNVKKNLIYSDNNIKIKKHGQMICGTGFDADTKLETVAIKNQRMVLD